MLKRTRRLLGFLLRTYRTYRNEDNILIYQMGKVGSTSIAQALGERAIQIHNFYAGNEPCPYRPRYPSSLYKAPVHWMFYVLIRLGIRHRNELKIITLVRDPVARNVSMYFQDLPYWLAYYFSEVRPGPRSRRNVDPLVDCFRKTFNHRYPLEWFDKELKRLTGVDVYEYFFDTATGIAEIQQGRVRMLIIQTEKLSRSWHAVERFCGRGLECREDNRGENQWYAPLYTEFLKSCCVPEEELEDIYGSRYATFFFSEESRAKFKQRWRRPAENTTSAERVI